LALQREDRARQAEAETEADRDAAITRSGPSVCTSNALRQPASDMIRRPAATPVASTVWIAAIERALPWPLAAGISAPRQARVRSRRHVGRCR